MARRRDPLDLLVVRPWLATWRGGESYAHFDALPMRSEDGHTPDRYGDLRVFGRGDDERTRLHLDAFRGFCQLSRQRSGRS